MAAKEIVEIENEYFTLETSSNFFKEATLEKAAQYLKERLGDNSYTLAEAFEILRAHNENAEEDQLSNYVFPLYELYAESLNLPEG